MEIDKNTVKFSLDNNFSWEKYENDVNRLVLNAMTPVNVIWDLREMNKIPSMTIIGKQVLLMKTNKKKIKERIVQNIVYVKTNYLKSKIEWIFKHLYKPENPTKIISEEDNVETDILV